jgi:hypothetical protein
MLAAVAAVAAVAARGCLSSLVLLLRVNTNNLSNTWLNVMPMCHIFKYINQP